jgi:hypothetical protein
MSTAIEKLKAFIGKFKKSKKVEAPAATEAASAARKLI